jgi:hypothetical protein
MIKLKLLGNRADIMQEIIIHIILIALIFGMFFLASLDKAGSRQVKQQVIEKEIALLIDSSPSGMEFSLNKLNLNGKIDNVEIKEGKVFVSVDGLQSLKGYPFFSKYSVSVENKDTSFVVSVK